MIEVIGVSQRFDTQRGEIHALDRIDLEVHENEFVTLVGRSGCGKSTLLRIISGLIRPTVGAVRVAGEQVARPRRDVSVMFQRPALLPWRNVRKNVLLPVEMLGLDKRQYTDRAQALIELAGLAGFEEKLPHELSGGMQQRVSLVRSLIQRPKVLLMDEPFSALDALTREEMSVELQRVVAEESTTIVFVTHSIDEAVLLADRVVVLSPRPGRLERIVDVPIPRPRTLGHNAHADQVSAISAELHDLLQPAPQVAT
ncbi:ABC transporter ATP-binding protein [Phytoactinopolyspora limicola]|uniref:ABC transporter ATP-binding protein n=1 Tax=Phytoactinopolyspora limicola TaxID=2715536 RepID=UPI00140B5528|nr:ABC transporter ATP-binding protein [Phytoactinopolyspora limicola]